MAPAITLTKKDRKTLRSWSRGRSTPARLAPRARIVLLAADGRENIDIANELGTDRQTVGRWRTRFLKEGIEGIRKDRARAGRTRRKRQAVAEKIIHKTTREKPKNATHWSTRTLAAELGINATLAPGVEGRGPEAAPDADVQTQQRPGVRGEAHRRGGAVPEPARARAGAQRRREEPGAGAGPHAAGAAAETRACGDDDARLQTQRHDHAVRGDGDGPGERSSHAA